LEAKVEKLTKFLAQTNKLLKDSKATVAEQQTTIDQLNSQLKEQAANVQEMKKVRPDT